MNSVANSFKKAQKAFLCPYCCNEFNRSDAVLKHQKSEKCETFKNSTNPRLHITKLFYKEHKGEISEWLNNEIAIFARNQKQKKKMKKM